VEPYIHSRYTPSWHGQESLLKWYIRSSEPPWPQLAVFVCVAASGMAGITTPPSGRHSLPVRGMQVQRRGVTPPLENITEGRVSK